MTPPSERQPITRALVSVYDKTGIDQLAQGLRQAGVEVVSTGSTARALQQAGVDVRPVEEVTGSPEVLDGRVKTLHPGIHAGILADRRLASHRDQLDQLRVAPFDLVVSNLYPFEQTVAAGAGFDETIEQIDIGGPSMVRGAAKNHANVAIITDPSQYPALLEALGRGGFTAAERLHLAALAFQHTASYDMAVAGWLSGQDAAQSAATPSGQDPVQQGSERQGSGQQFLPWIAESLHLVSPLRYGENAHQQAALYASDLAAPGLVQAEQLHGKAMSFNNFTDGEAAYRTAYDFTEPTVAIIKHANPCGIASAGDIARAHELAHQTDPISAYGGVVAANRPVSVAMAEQVAEIFTEVLIAPAFEDGALEVLQRKKNIRLLLAPDYPRAALRTQKVSISGGALVQFADRIDAEGDEPSNWQLVSGDAADGQTLADLEFAWRAVRSVKSNAILLASNRAAVGVGMGQVNRVDSCRLAVERSQGRARGAVAASDAFFPFADGAQVLLDAGVRAIVQPGGSVRDDQTIEAARAAGVTMYLTGTRHFFH